MSDAVDVGGGVLGGIHRSESFQRNFVDQAIPVSRQALGAKGDGDVFPPAVPSHPQKQASSQMRYHRPPIRVTSLPGYLPGYLPSLETLCHVAQPPRQQQQTLVQVRHWLYPPLADDANHKNEEP